MKKTVLGVLCLVFALVMFASAAPFSNTIKVNLLGGIGVEYETTAPAGLSSTLGSIIKPLTKTTPKDQFTVVLGGRIGGGFGGSGAVRYYLEPSTMKGIFAQTGAYALGAVVGSNFYLTTGISIEGGYKYVMDNGITAEASAGLSTGILSINSVTGLGFPIRPGFVFGVGVGYSW